MGNGGGVYVREKKMALGVLVLALALCIYILHSTNIFSGQSTHYRQNLNEITLGQIDQIKNDVRYKSSSSYDWKVSSALQSIQVGDAVFAGEKSEAQVKLNQGGDVTINENSLVIFKEIRKEKLANLMQGSFRLQVRGRAKVAIRGKVTTFEGQNSDLQIYTDDSHQPKLKVLAGAVKLTLEGDTKPRVMVENDVVRIPAQDLTESVGISQIEKQTPSMIFASQIQKFSTNEFQFTFDIPDVYTLGIEDHNDKQELNVASEPIHVRAPTRPLSKPGQIGKTARREVATKSDTNKRSVSHIFRRESEPEPEPELVSASQNREKTDDVAKNFWIWVGLGLSYSIITQDVASEQKIETAGFKIPSYLIRAGFWVLPDVGVDLGFKNTPAEIKGSPDIEVSGGDYNWSTMSGEGLWRFVQSPSASWTLRFGVQSHQLPLLVQTSATQLDITEAMVSTASVGFDYQKRFFPKTYFDWQMRYQAPFSSSSGAGSEFSVQSQFVFDGSIGASFRLKHSLSVGAYWHGQWHQYKFNYSSSSFVFNGDQSLFHSTMDLRLGLEF